MADLTQEPWSLFTAEEVAEIEAQAIPFGSNRTLDALQFAAGWAARVESAPEQYCIEIRKRPRMKHTAGTTIG